MDEKRIEEFKKRFVSSGTKSIRYQYSHVAMEEVIKNPEEYIVPECLPACKSLWNKNIETFMVSNNDDDNLYVLLNDNLSTENIEIFYRMMKEDSRYFIDNYRKSYGIYVSGKDEKASQELKNLVDVFQIQDTIRFQTEEEFLDSYKKTGGKFDKTDEYGHLHWRYNSKLKNATLEEALKNEGKEALYIPSERRVYQDILYLKWHKKYLESLKNSKSDEERHKIRK